MASLKYHVMVCTNTRPPLAGPSCGQRQGHEILFRLRELIERHNLQEQVRANGTDCLGPCELGATLMVYPEGVWYRQVQPADVEEIVESHLRGGKPVKRLLMVGSAGKSA